MLKTFFRSPIRRHSYSQPLERQSAFQELEEYTSKCLTTLKETLQSKGYTIVDEFGCAGFNTNKFLKWSGGINKGRPNAEDLKHAEEFALRMKG